MEVVLGAESMWPGIPFPGMPPPPPFVPGIMPPPAIVPRDFIMSAGSWLSQPYWPPLDCEPPIIARIAA